MCYWTHPDPSQPQVPEVIVSKTRTHSHMVMINPDIVDTTRGIAHITADKAVADGPDPGNSQWVFTGNVHADMAEGQLRANSATVQLTDSSIAWIKAQGSPALFQRLPNNPLEPAGNAPSAPTSAPTAPAQKANLANLTVHGHADSITYNANDDQVLLIGNTWFTDGCNDIISQQVTYNMTTQTVEASAAPGSNAPVHGTIRNTHPGSGTGCSATAGLAQGSVAPAGGTPQPPAAGTTQAPAAGATRAPAALTPQAPATPAPQAPAPQAPGARSASPAGSPVSDPAGSSLPGLANRAGTGEP